MGLASLQDSYRNGDVRDEDLHTDATLREKFSKGKSLARDIVRNWHWAPSLPFKMDGSHDRLHNNSCSQNVQKGNNEL